MEACFMRSSRSLKTVFILLFLSLSLQSFAQVDAENKSPAPVPNKPDAKPPEDLSRWPGFLMAFEGGSGRFSSSNPGPTAYGGLKIGGGGITLDLGYDRIPAHNGFSTELSGMLPIFRFPRPQSNEMKKYLRIYAEPGLGYRAFGGVGTYASAKVMMVLFSDHKLTASGSNWTPFVEIQRRFALQPDQHGDFRIMIGIISAICEHCGLD
jgi:hypothetical protein